jgi:hypothetical protein
MTRLEGASTLRREIKIHGLEEPVQAEMTAQGISFWIKGSKKRVTVGWRQAVIAGQTGTDVPSFLMNKPLELLQYQITKAQKRAQ